MLALATTTYDTYIHTNRLKKIYGNNSSQFLYMAGIFVLYTSEILKCKCESWCFDYVVLVVVVAVVVVVSSSYCSSSNTPVGNRYPQRGPSAKSINSFNIARPCMYHCNCSKFYNCKYITKRRPSLLFSSVVGSIYGYFSVYS